MTDLGLLGCTIESNANAINNVGQVVGYSQTINGISIATLWNGNNVIDLNSFLTASTKSAGWVLTDATGINDNGWIVGDAVNAQLGETHAFELSISPVPEPETYGMMLAGLGLFGFIAYRRKNDSSGMPMAA